MTVNYVTRGAGFCLPLFLMAFLFISPAFSKPQRIVSINLCTDQFLLALAEPEQILALSPFARDGEMSHYSEKAKEIPLIRDDAESVIRMRPDLVLASAFSKPNTLKLIRKQGIKVVTLGYPGSLEEIAKQHYVVGKAIGQSVNGKMSQERFLGLMRDTQGIFDQSDKTALYYQRGGYVSGKNSLVGLLLAHTGLKNHAGTHNISAYGNLPLELLLFNPPDIFMIAKEYRSSADQGHQLLKHPALQRILQKKTIVKFPVSETVCPGPSTVGALKRLRALKNHKKLFKQQ